MTDDAGRLTFPCGACVLSVTVTLHTRDSERAWAWYMLDAPHVRCPSCGELLSFPKLPASNADLHPAHYWWASFTTSEQRELGGDVLRWWGRLRGKRRLELRAKMARRDTRP
jgi:hypothetical protein